MLALLFSIISRNYDLYDGCVKCRPIKKLLTYLVRQFYCCKMYSKYLHNFNRRLSILRKARTDLDQNSRITVHTQYIQQTTKPPLCIHTEIGPLSVLCNTQGPLIKVKLSVQDRLASIVFNHVVEEIRNSRFNFPFSSENAMCYIIGQIWNYKRQDKVYFF